MGKLFCIMGKSSSGKDSVFNKIKNDRDLNLTEVILYTTRPIRNNEKDGETYHFVDNEVFEEIQKAGKVIECRTYSTVYGPWHYFMVEDGQVDLDQHDYVVIETLEGYHQVRKYYGGDRIVPVYIEVEDGERLLRAIGRERQQDVPKYQEMCRRFLADCNDFSEEKLMQEHIDVRFENDDFEECYNRIKAAILKVQCYT